MRDILLYCNVCGSDRIENKALMLCASCAHAQRKSDRIDKNNALKAKPKSLKPQYKVIKKISEKRKEVLKDYTSLRKQYLIKHPTCQAKLIDCKGFSNQIHHCSTSHLDHNNVFTWLAVCESCHHAIETVMSSKDRRLMGFLI